MKKTIIAIVAFFYLVISSGFTVHIHYCMNKLAGWGLFHLDKDTLEPKEKIEVVRYKWNYLICTPQQVDRLQKFIRQ